jgi:hypothetical protein
MIMVNDSYHYIKWSVIIIAENKPDVAESWT